MIKDDIKNPERIGMSPTAIVEGSEESAIGLHSLKSHKEVGLVISKRADDSFWGGDEASILSSEKAHALGKALIELSGIDEEPVEDKPLHISLEEFRELREGDQVILRHDTASDEVFKFGYEVRFQHEIQGRTPATVDKIDTGDDSVRLINSNGEYGWFLYKAVKEVVAKASKNISQEEFDSIEAGDKEVIKAPKEHFRVRLSTKIWYAGKGGQITTDKDYAAIMNKPHAENVVKKYGGQLVKVDYLELEDK